MSQIIYPITHLPPVIDIGKQTEKGVTRIGFDVHEWLDDWPGMAFSVQPTRPGEKESYFAASEMVGSVVFWLVGAVDTEKPGSGTVEVLGVTEDERKLSFMCRTSIANTNTATVAEIPEPNRPWVDQVILAADSAAKSATESEASADKAAASAKEAEESVKDFFIVKIPFILNANPQKTDKTQAEIIEAIEAGKVCMLVSTLYNRVYDSASIEDGAPVFRRYGFDNKTNKSFAETVTVNADDTVTSFYTEPILTPSPGVLHFRGAVNASYNGDKHVTVEIPSGGAGPFTVNATITTMSDVNLTGYAIFDKTFAETLAAVKAGRYVTCRVDLGDDVVHIVPACGYGSDLVEFILAVNGVQLRVRYFEGFEEGSVEITPPAS